MHNAKGTWLSTIITAVANFSTQYNFQSISVVLLMMSTNECTATPHSCEEGDQAVWVQSTTSAAVFVGSIVGQLTLGYLGDLFSRNFALCWTLVLAGFSAILCAVASTGSAESTYSVIIVFRFLLGVGLGGVFPLAAAKASEDHSRTDDFSEEKQTNSSASCWSFFWQMPGIFLPWCFGYFFMQSDVLSTTNRWKLILGFGAVPCFVAAGLLLLEAYLEGSSLFVAQKSSTSNEIPLSRIVQLVGERDNLRKLSVTGGCWFLFNIVIYGIGLIAGTIIKAISSNHSNVSSRGNIENSSSKQMIAGAATIVVCAISITLIPVLGLRRLQMLAFTIVTVYCVLLAALFNFLKEHNPHALFALYVLAYSSLNFGLGATCYSMPSSVYPKEIRTTFGGMSAAMGKAGATLGAFSFKYIALSSIGYPGLMGICAGIVALAGFLTAFVLSPNDFRDFQSMQIEEAKSRKMHKPSVSESVKTEDISGKTDGRDIEYARVGEVEMMEVEDIDIVTAHQVEETTVTQLAV
eukprot:gene13132-14415_t